MEIFEFLAAHAIPYERCDHPAVFTCEEAARLVPELPGAKTKNLFLRDGKGKRHFLLTVSAEKSVDLKACAAALGVQGLSLASPERLATHLGLKPGSVSLLATINDNAHAVEVLIDAELWEQTAFLCHPLVNTSTLVLKKDDLLKFLEISKHAPRIVPVPAREDVAATTELP